MGSLLVEHADRPSNFLPFIYFKDSGRFIQWRRVGLSDLPHKFHAANGMAQYALVFFLLSFGLGGRGEEFFSFFFCSQHLPFKFPMGSH